METIAITSANGRIGQRLLPMLNEAGYRTVALVRKDQPLLADEVVTDWMNAQAAQSALENADIIIHLSGEWSSRTQAGYHASNVATTARVAQALQRGRARRVIYVSFVDADATSSNWFLSAKGQAEDLLRATGKEAIILRCPSIIGTPDRPTEVETNFISQDGKPIMMVGNGQQRWRPVLQDNVLSVMMAALNKGKAGTYDWTGIEELSADEVIRLINRGNHVKIRYIPGWLARIMSRVVPDLPPTTVDVMLRDLTGNPEPAMQAFGVVPLSIRQAWGK